MRSLKILVKGRVQGVNFRNMTKQFCDENEITGSVENKEDGSVLIIARGENEIIDELLRWLKTSPGFSKVESVTASESKINQRSNDFEIIRDGGIFRDKSKAFKHFAKRMLGDE